jgi:hypothetical protein
MSKLARPVRLAYQPPANNTFLSEQTSTSHQPPAKRTGWWPGGTRMGHPTETALESGNPSSPNSRNFFCLSMIFKNL